SPACAWLPCTAAITMLPTCWRELRREHLALPSEAGSWKGPGRSRELRNKFRPTFAGRLPERWALSVPRGGLFVGRADCQQLCFTQKRSDYRQPDGQPAARKTTGN